MIGPVASIARRITPTTVARLALLAVLLAASGQSPAKPVQQPGTCITQATYFYPEVRLRKLHLVRPDLIPYPINYEIYC